MIHFLTKEEKRKLLERYGGKAQALVAVEETTELSQLLLKYANRGISLEKIRISIVSEVADVLIMLDQMLEEFKISDEILNAEINYKKERLFRRIGE